ncbi:MAG: hypothetical protein LBH14_01660 [Desulfobulbaceae bacterium]|jgi:hypothetical protein|nr:hypothetical protein [Desulfobulbaceae bacterium]
MKRIIIAVAAITTLFLATQAMADEYVPGYTKENGTQVQGYHRTNPNYTQYDNYSTKGNRNPYTGEKGIKVPK